MKLFRILTATCAASLLSLPALADPGNGNGNSNSNSGNSSTAIPAAPVGVLSANPQVVQTGTYPTLTWSIVYPTAVSDVAVVTPPGSITLTQQVYVDVRPVGVAVTDCDGGEDIDTIHAEARISVNGSDFQQLFYGTNDDVDPAASLYTKKLNKNTTINYGGRYVKNGDWTSFYTSKNANFQVVVLANGDAIPTTYDLSSSGRMASFLNPYVDGTGKVNIGPMSLLVLMEFAETDHSSACFDYQDMVLLVSFSPKNNNGHGNNIDGVDVSNPGKGKGGPNGEVDPSGDIDDER